MEEEARALARRARAIEELRCLSALADQADGTPTKRLRPAVAEPDDTPGDDTPADRPPTVAESDDTPAETEQECNHFSLRGYVAMLQKKDPKLRSNVFRNTAQYDEHHDSSPILLSKHHRWDCSKCLDRVKVSGHRPTSGNVFMKQDEMNDGCSISKITTRPSIRPSTQNVDPAYISCLSDCHSTNRVDEEEVDSS